MFDWHDKQYLDIPRQITTKAPPNLGLVIITVVVVLLTMTSFAPERSLAKPGKTKSEPSDSDSGNLRPYASVGVQAGTPKATEVSLGLTYWQRSGSQAKGPVIMATLGQDRMQKRRIYQSIDVGFFGQGQGWPGGIYLMTGRMMDETKEKGRFVGLVMQALIFPTVTIRRTSGSDGDRWEFGVLVKYPVILGECFLDCKS